MIEYDEYELLELFESEPKIIEKKAGIYKYKRLDVYGFTFELYLSLYDEYCATGIWYKNFTNPIFDIGLDKIENIKCKKDKLIIQQRGTAKDIVIYFQPTYTFVFEDRIS